MTRTDCKSDQMHKEVISTIWSYGKFCPPWETLISHWSHWSDPNITWRPAGQGIRSPRWLHLACFHTPRSWCYETGRNSCGSNGSYIYLQFVYFDDREVPVIPVERSPASLSSSCDSWRHCRHIFIIMREAVQKKVFFRSCWNRLK